jgi:hypothetical protein
MLMAKLSLMAPSLCHARGIRAIDTRTDLCRDVECLLAKDTVFRHPVCSVEKTGPANHVCLAGKDMLYRTRDPSGLFPNIALSLVLPVVEPLAGRPSEAAGASHWGV